MIKNKKIAICIPCYKVERQIIDVIKSIPEYVDNIIVVDDACPNLTGLYVEKMKFPKVTVLFHKKNLGVGGAMITGYKHALLLGSDIIIKVDGDGQMDLSYLEQLIFPILNGEADYVKANRFRHRSSIKVMPKIRLFGNSLLSFGVKLCSGYWNIMDPTNGYTAINKEVLNILNLDKISNRYFFEIDMLINLNIINAVVLDIPVPAHYNNEPSSLNVPKIILEFPPKLMKGLIKRIFLKYYLYDFNMASIYILVGLPSFIWGIFFGLYRWFLAIKYNIVNTTGTVMLSVLPIVIGLQLILQAINIDMSLIPKRRN